MMSAPRPPPSGYLRVDNGVYCTGAQRALIVDRGYPVCRKGRDESARTSFDSRQRRRSIRVEPENRGKLLATTVGTAQDFR